MAHLNASGQSLLGVFFAEPVLETIFREKTKTLIDCIDDQRGYKPQCAFDQEKR
jgi:hypothetical protein